MISSKAAGTSNLSLKTTNDSDNATLEGILHALLAIDRTLSTRARPGIFRPPTDYLQRGFRLRRRNSKDRGQRRRKAPGESGPTPELNTRNQKANNNGSKRLPQVLLNSRSGSGRLREALVGLYTETPDGQFASNVFEGRQKQQQTGTTPKGTAFLPPMNAPSKGFSANLNATQTRNKRELIGAASSRAEPIAAPSNAAAHNLLDHYARYRRISSRHEATSKTDSQPFRQTRDSIPSTAGQATRAKELSRNEQRESAPMNGHSRQSFSTVSTNAVTSEAVRRRNKGAGQRGEQSSASSAAPPTADKKKAPLVLSEEYMRQHHQPNGFTHTHRAASTASTSHSRFRDASSAHSRRSAASSAHSSRTTRSTRSVRSANSSSSAHSKTSGRVSIDLDSMRRGVTVRQAAADRVTMENLQFASRLVALNSRRGPYNREIQLEDYVTQLSAVLAPSAINKLRKEFAASAAAVESQYQSQD